MTVRTGPKAAAPCHPSGRAPQRRRRLRWVAVAAAAGIVLVVLGAWASLGDHGVADAFVGGIRRGLAELSG